MGLILFALFVGVPIAEIALFILVGEQIGVLATVAIVILTAIAGAALVRHQGIGTAQRARHDIEANRMPTGAMAEGLAILAAGALLLTPGFLTDAIGFALLVPPLRRSIIGRVGNWLAGKVTVVGMDGAASGYPGGTGPGGYYGRDDTIDGEAVEVEPETDAEDGTRSISDRRNDPGSPWNRG